jgi:NADPH2:quinone reductase
MNSHATMQAAVLDAHGAPFRLATIARPIAGPGEVLVRVASSGVNPLDLKIHAGTADHARHKLPAILGIDLAGTVAAVGPGVTRFRPGDEVFGMTGGVGGHPGSLAQYAAVDADLLALKSANLSMREASVLPLVFITAWEGLVDRMAVRADQSVLVLGGAGGVGQMAIQIAGARGAVVFATGSASGRTTIERLGASFVDRSEPVEAFVTRLTGRRGFDLVYDTVGGAALDAGFTAVRRFGHVASALGWGTHAPAPLSFRAASYSGIFTLSPLLTGEGRAHHGEILTEATRMAEAGQLSPSLDPRRFTLAGLEEAYRPIAEVRPRASYLSTSSKGEATSRKGRSASRRSRAASRTSRTRKRRATSKAGADAEAGNI